MHGAFSTQTYPAKIKGGSGSKALRQQAQGKPVCTHSGSKKQLFATAIGDASWLNYTVQVRAMVEKEPQPSNNGTEQQIFIGSHAGQGPVAPETIFDVVACPGFVLVLKMGGSWSLLQGMERIVLASGMQNKSNWSAGEWMNITLAVELHQQQAFAHTDPARTSPCDMSDNQKWAFDDGAPGQLCNAGKQCLVIPNCDTSLSSKLLFTPPIAPGTTCTSNCSCKPNPGSRSENRDPQNCSIIISIFPLFKYLFLSGKKCGLEPGDLDCYANGQFKFEGNKLVSGLNRSATQCVYERKDKTLGVRACEQNSGDGSVRGDGAGLWSYDPSGKSLLNVHSGQCLGVAPPALSFRAFVNASVNGEQLYAKRGDIPLNGQASGAVFLGSGVHFTWFDDFHVRPS